MTTTNEITLNKGQKEAADGFFNFLFTDEKEYILSGAGGYGKTFLMGHIIDSIIPKYHEMCKMLDTPSTYENVVMTATTNKAADVLAKATNRPTGTIHSFLNLKVHEDYSNGRMTIKPTRNWVVHENLILFIDEAFTIDSPLLKYIRTGTRNCKIVYVGDGFQLPPVMEEVCPIVSKTIPYFQLTEPMRNAHSPELLNICNQLRLTVNDGIFKPIQVKPGVIDHVNSDEMQKAIKHYFVDNETNSKILAYTNNQVISYNKYIRNLRQLPEAFSNGEEVILNSPIGVRERMLAVEEELIINDISGQTDVLTLPHNGEIEFRFCTLTDKFGATHKDIKLPNNKEHLHNLIKFYAKKKDWHTYFKLKQEFPDLREKDASTVHKSQGSTYDTVFIDLTDLGQCRKPTLAARLLYVAFSRATTRIIMYGDLPEKFGGISYDE